MFEWLRRLFGDRDEDRRRVLHAITTLEARGEAAYDYPIWVELGHLYPAGRVMPFGRFYRALNALLTADAVTVYREPSAVTHELGRPVRWYYRVRREDEA